MSSIVTVTPAPAIDQTYHLARLDIGEVNRAESVNTELSGKGVNVARALALGGARVSAVVPIGAQARALAEEGGFGDLLSIVDEAGRTRVNTTILDAAGSTTKVNENPVPLTAEIWQEVRSRSASELERLEAEWLVVSGSIPGLAGTDKPVPFLDLVRDASSKGVRVAVDTAGAALRLVARSLPDVALIKPNTLELAELVERPLRTVGDVIDAARGLNQAGCEIVYVSMGADGALAVTDEGVWHAWARATVVNTAGAGDASLAGFLVGSSSIARAVDVPAGIRLAASWGALSVSQPTTLLSAPETAPSAQLVVDPDPSTPLGEPALLP